MEGAGLLHRENNAVISVTGISNVERNSKFTSLTGSMMRRMRLADITNLTSNGRTERSDVTNNQENTKAAPSDSSKAYIAQLLKENSAMMRLIGERNKFIELSGIEMQKLRFTLQESNLQNLLLARANTQLLAEHNLDKERLKALQHELGCTVAVLRAKTLELEEKNKLIKQQREMVFSEQIMEGDAKLDIAMGDDAPVPANHKKACNTNRKRTLRNQSLGSATVSQQVVTVEKDESRRKSLRRRSSRLKNEPTEDSAPSVSDAIMSLVNEEQDRNTSFQNQSQGAQIKIPICSLASDPMHEDSSGQLDSLAPLVSGSITNLVKEEQKDWKRSPQIENQGLRRSSVGRPMRRAAEKVSSYKEVPLNVKMRRAE